MFCSARIFVLSFLLLLVRAAPNFPNSTTSIASSTSSASEITSAPQIVTTTESPTCGKYVGQYCNRTEMPYYSWDVANYVNPYSDADVDRGIANSTQLYCLTLFSEQLATWFETAPVSASLVPATTSFLSYAPVVTEIVVPAYSSYAYLSQFSYSAATPCCSSCLVSGGSVQVYQWPTPAPSPPVSTLVDVKNNFTFISPSVYVAFQSLYATNLCGTIGSVIAATTIGFAPGELSTSNNYLANTAGLYPDVGILQFTEATFGGQENCGPTTSTFYSVLEAYSQFSNAAAASQYAAGSNELVCDGDVRGGECFPVKSVSGNVRTIVVTYNPCSPLLSVPATLYSLVPDWTGCGPALTAFFDPPYILSTGGALTAPGLRVTAVDAPASLTAGAAVAPPTPSMTSATSTSVQAGLVAPSVADPIAQIPIPTSTSSSPLPKDSPAPPSSSIAPAPAPSPAAIIIGSSIVTADPSSEFIVGSQTLSAGGQITVSSTVYSLAGNGATLLVGDPDNPLHTSTQILPAPAPAVAPSNVVIGSQTLMPGGAALTVSGTIVSLLPGGSSVVVQGVTQPLAAILGTPITTSEDEYIFGTQTLVAGGPAITVSGTILSLQAGGSNVVVGGSATEAASVLIGQGGKSTKVLETETAKGGGIGGIIASIGGFVGGQTPASEASTTRTSSYVQVTGGVAFNGTTFTGNGVRGIYRSMWGVLAGMVLGALGILWL